ncbi:MAG: hypothetical protein ACLUNV_10855 [Sutterella wadsworthensis]
MELERLGRGRLEDYVAQITDTLEIAREMYPGRRVSLDGLCLMHKIDNSARVFHGALLDSQLLAEVYLTMTRGQGEIDLDNWGDAVEIPPEIIARLTMPEPSPEELAEHEKMLGQGRQAVQGDLRMAQGARHRRRGEGVVVFAACAKRARRSILSIPAS